MAYLRSLKCRPCPSSAALLALLWFTGCGGISAYPVDGTIVYADGTPAKDLAGYVVDFDPVDGEHSASGVVGADGKFTVSTFSDSPDGAVPGKYQVALSPPLPEADVPAPRPIIRPSYSDFATSGLSVEIKPQKNVVQLTVERLKSR